MNEATRDLADDTRLKTVADPKARAMNFDRLLPIVSWVYETLEKATEVADSSMSKKEGLVLLILYKRKGLVETGRELEEIFRLGTMRTIPVELPRTSGLRWRAC